MVLKDPVFGFFFFFFFFFFFLSKSSKFRVVWTIRLCSNFTSMCFSDRAFYVTIADAEIRGLKSLHTLFDKYLDHMLMKFVQNRAV